MDFINLQVVFNNFKISLLDLTENLFLFLICTSHFKQLHQSNKILSEIEVEMIKKENTMTMQRRLCSQKKPRTTEA